MKPKFIVAIIAATLAAPLSLTPLLAQTPDADAEVKTSAPPAAAKPAPAGDLVQVATSAGVFTTLLKAANEANLTEQLRSGGPFTIFAPTDEAFAKLPPGALDALMKDKAKLAELLRYHIMQGAVMAKDVKAGKARMASGKEALVGSTGGVTIDNATVVKADIVASNGVIHVIDRVLMPK